MPSCSRAPTSYLVRLSLANIYLIIQVAMVVVALVGGMWLSIFSGLIAAIMDRLSWLQYLYYLSYIKVGTTPIKYTPQVSCWLQAIKYYQLSNCTQWYISCNTPTPEMPRVKGWRGFTNWYTTVVQFDNDFILYFTDILLYRVVYQIFNWCTTLYSGISFAIPSLCSNQIVRYNRSIV